MSMIFPRALEVAAKTFADRPAMVGEILIDVLGYRKPKKASEVHNYIVNECLTEITARNQARVDAAERKRRWRNGKTPSLKGVK